MSAAVIALPTAAPSKVVQNKRSGRLPREVMKLNKQRWLREQSSEKAYQLDRLRRQVRGFEQCVADARYELAKALQS